MGWATFTGLPLIKFHITDQYDNDQNKNLPKQQEDYSDTKKVGRSLLSLHNVYLYIIIFFWYQMPCTSLSLISLKSLRFCNILILN